MLRTLRPIGWLVGGRGLCFRIFIYSTWGRGAAGAVRVTGVCKLLYNNVITKNFTQVLIALERMPFGGRR